MRRVSLKRVFASFTTIVIGVALLVAMWHCDNGYGDFDMRTAGPLWFAAGAAIGAGLMIPYKRTLWGLKMGLKVQLVIVAAYITLLSVGALIGCLLGG